MTNATGNATATDGGYGTGCLRDEYESARDLLVRTIAQLGAALDLRELLWCSALDLDEARQLLHQERSRRIAYAKEMGRQKAMAYA